MHRVAIVVLADAETKGDLGRVFNALMAADEFAEAGDEVRLVFDGAGVKWIPELSNPEHKAHGLFAKLKPHVTDVCRYCAGAFGVDDKVKGDDAPLTGGGYQDHPSFRRLIDEGFQVITF